MFRCYRATKVLLYTLISFSFFFFSPRTTTYTSVLFAKLALCLVRMYTWTFKFHHFPANVCSVTETMGHGPHR